jgi:ribosome modulation factor
MLASRCRRVNVNLLTDAGAWGKVRALPIKDEIYMARQIKNVIGEDGQVVELRPGRSRNRPPKAGQAAEGQEPEQQAEAAEGAEPSQDKPKRGRGRPSKPKGNGPSPAEKKEALANYTILKTEAARVSQQIASLLARFEALGGDRKMLKLMHSLSMVEKSEARAYIQNAQTYAIDMDIIEVEEDGQANFNGLFGGARDPNLPLPKTPEDLSASARLKVAQAYSAGYEAGTMGMKLGDNPYAHDPGSESFVQWRNGMEDGLGDKVRAGGMAEERVEPTDDGAPLFEPPPEVA